MALRPHLSVVTPFSFFAGGLVMTAMMNLREIEKKKFAHVEFLALEPEIKKYMSEGYSVIGIHRLLLSHKQILMSYHTFARYILPSRKNLTMNWENSNKTSKVV
jgi:hypothetical protein